MDQDKIYRFFHGNSTQAEARQVLAWLNAKKSEPEVIDLIRSYWEEADDINWNSDESWQNFLQRIEDKNLIKGQSEETRYQEIRHYQQEINKRRNQNWLLKIAASIVLIFSVAYYFWHISTKTGEPASFPYVTTMLEKNTEKGQKLTVFLKDGTKVILNSESKLVYPQFFDDSLRLVYLTGEAFFVVAKNEKVPFKVISTSAETTVLGTQFNINSQSENQSVISVISGSVSVKLTSTTSADENTVQLNPGESVIANNDYNDLKVTGFDFEETVLWKEGILYFERAGFNQLIEKLEHWYGVDFEIIGSKNIEDKHYSGKFDNESLKNVLESISFSKNFTYQITGKKVIININN